MEELPVSEPFALQAIFCDLDPTAKALKFDAIMPAHQHGMNFDVDITRLDRNSYEISNIVFHMPGLWEARVTMETDGEAHTYKAEILLE